MPSATAVPGAAPQVVTEFDPRDVLLGRGAPIVNYKGNVVFRELVSTRKDEYMNTVSHQIKDDIARQIVDETARQNGRFLRRIETAEEASRLGLSTSDPVWIVADDDVAIEKVKQALRDKIAARSRAAESSSNPESRRKRPRTATATAVARASPPRMEPSPDTSRSEPTGGSLAASRQPQELAAQSINPGSLAYLLQANSRQQLLNPRQSGAPFSNLLPPQPQQPIPSGGDASFPFAAAASLLRSGPHSMPGSTVPNALASALGNGPSSAGHANVSLLALQQLERAQAEDASRRLATAVPPVETLRRLAVARAEQDRRLASLYPAAALQQLEREENRLVVLQQLELARAEEESRQASLSYVAALRRLELARIHTGSRLEDVSPLGSLQHQLELAQDREGNQPSALDILRQRQLAEHVQELRRMQSTSSQTMQPGLHSTASLPPATVTSLLEGIASVAAGQQQRNTLQQTPRQNVGQTFQMAGDSTFASLPTPSDFGRAKEGQAEPGATHHAAVDQQPSERQGDASGENQSSPSSSSTNEQDRKPRARPPLQRDSP